EVRRQIAYPHYWSYQFVAASAMYHAWNRRVKYVLERSFKRLPGGAGAQVSIGLLCCQSTQELAFGLTNLPTTVSSRVVGGVYLLACKSFDPAIWLQKRRRV